MLKRKKKAVFSPRIAANHGHDVAHLVRQLGSDDREIVEHQIVVTGRMVDRLFDENLIDHDQHLAATMLRDNYERSGLSMGSLAAQDPTAPHVSGGRTDHISINDEAAWQKYRRAMQQIGQWRHVIRRVVIDEETPSAYGAKMRCSGLGTLRIGLDRLVKHYGLVARRGEVS